MLGWGSDGNKIARAELDGGEKGFGRISRVGASGRRPNEVYDKPTEAICQYLK
jgi:hypothetical protein